MGKLCLTKVEGLVAQVKRDSKANTVVDMEAAFRRIVAIGLQMCSMRGALRDHGDALL